MFFDFDDRHTETPTLGSALSQREGVLLSIIVHGVLIAAMLVLPQTEFVQAMADRAREAAMERQAELLRRQQQEQQAPRFVFVQPRLDTPAPAAPPRAELSDVDRVARTVERAPAPTNPLPFSRGNSTARVEASPEMRARGQGPRPDPSPPMQGQPQADQASNGEGRDLAYDSGRGTPVAPARTEAPPRTGVGGGSLGDALRNLQRYVENQSFNNPDGGDGQFGPSIQFDTKGVEFGPWLRRFIAQIKRNWFIPYAAMSLRGHVVITFYVHKDGRITDLTVRKPSGVEAFNHAAFNALVSSNPTVSLPPEYPDDRAFFTVTFYYNETPPSP
jgi:TonB family protein